MLLAGRRVFTHPLFLACLIGAFLFQPIGAVSIFLPSATAVAQSIAIPQLTQWETNMRTFGSMHCVLGTLDNAYYDAERVYYQIANYTGDPSWMACSQLGETVYRDQYVLPNNGNVPGHWNFTTGLRTDYEHSADGTSKNAAILLSQNAAYARDGTPLAWTQSADTSREVAYAILSYINTEALGEPPRQRRVDLVNQAYDHMAQWFVRFAWPGPWQQSPQETGRLAPFMVGLTAHTLIRDWEQTNDPRLIPALRLAADWMWANAWIPSAEAMWYEFPDQTQACCQASGAAPDLNLLIAPMYAFLYRQTGETKYRDEGDAIFAGGVKFAGLGGGKQFDQNYWWSFDYVKWRAAAPPAADTLRPTVAITAPSSGATVSGPSITVSAVASDNVGVASMQFTLDGTNLGPAVTALPYTLTWNTTTAANGSHVLAAKASDAAGNVGSSAPVTLTVANADTTPPVVTVTTPGSGATVSGAITISAYASDNIGVAGVQFRIDGANFGTEVSTPPFAVAWNTAIVPDGLHTLTAVARDSAGNRTTSAAVSITVNNGVVTAPPVITSVAVSTITTSGALIAWVTSEPADSQVEYGASTSYGSVTPLDAGMVTAHGVTLTGLTAGTSYYYRVKSKNAASNQAVSGDFTFATTPAATGPAPQDSGSPPPAQASGNAAGGTSGGSGVASGGAAGGAASMPGSLGTGATASPIPGALSVEGASAPAPLAGNLSVGSAPGQVQSVVWSNLVNVTASGSSLTKISGCDGCPDAGAVSQQRITTGDGYLEFTASETATWRRIGFTSGSPGTGRGELRFAISLRPGGIADVREGAMLRTNATYTRGDVFRIAVVSGTVRYFKNGRLLYLSGAAPSYPLEVTTLLLSRGATVTHAMISGRLSVGTWLPVHPRLLVAFPPSPPLATRCSRNDISAGVPVPWVRVFGPSDRVEGAKVV